MFSVSISDDLHSHGRNQRRDFLVKRAKRGGQRNITRRVAPLVKFRHGLDCLKLPVGKHRRMPMKRESRQRVKLLIVGESAVRPERAAADGEFLEKWLAVAEFHPFFGAQSRCDRIWRCGHNRLLVQVGSVSALIRQMSAHQPTRTVAQVTKIQA